MSKRWLWNLLSLSLVLLLLSHQQAGAQSGPGIYFRETGHWVRGEFLEAYERSKNPLRIYGLPITDAFRDSPTGPIVQYFEKARFVLYESEQYPLRVRLTPLGQVIYEDTGPGTPLSGPSSLAGCREFTDTGKKVCYAFLEFFELNGGLPQFGYPISDFEAQAGRIVQYFQLARMEWHPELPIGQRVRLGDLGREYFKIHKQDYRRLLPNPENSLPLFILNLRTTVNLGMRVTPLDGTQSIIVMVQNQNFLPVQGAAVYLTVRYPDGSTEAYDRQVTNTDGIFSGSFPFSTTEPAEIEVLVEAVFQGHRDTTLTSFQTWP